MVTKKEKNFWMKLLADGETNTVSSKRLSMIISILMLVILAFLSAFGYNCLEVFVYIFGGLVGAQSGLTTIEKCAQKSKNIQTIESENLNDYEKSTRKPTSLDVG